jgi:hypothetical protein
VEIMNSRDVRRGFVWGGGLILFGILLLFEAGLDIDLSEWIWAAFFLVAALVATALYYADRSDWAMLITVYVLWAAFLLNFLTALNILRDEGVAFFVLVAIAIPFLAVYRRDRKQWWALIPAYVLIAIGVMVALIGLGVLGDMLVPSYVMFAIAIPFFFVYFRNRKLWWALIPGGVLAAIGIAFLIAEAALDYIGAVVLLLVGGAILVGVLRRKPAPEAAAPPAEPEGAKIPEPEPILEESGLEEEGLE